MNEKILDMIRQTHCAECGRLPCHGAHIRSLSDRGTNNFFNLIPLCVKHVHEHDRIGTIAMMEKYRNVKLYVEKKGWKLVNKKLTHRDLKGEN
jgi:5-methylcytosine-specific restriction endonuclease McrA